MSVYIYYSQDEKELMNRAKSLGWRFITKIDGKLVGIPPETEAIDRNVEVITGVSMELWEL